ncbi:MAG: hypothetical protein ABJA70_21845 [Chryseolinea sp.]
MAKKTSKSTKPKKKAKKSVAKDQDIYLGFEPMGEMATIPSKSAKQDFPLLKSAVKN